MFMSIPIIFVLLAMMVISYVIAPKPKGPKPAALEQAENPTAEAGKEIAKLWGTALISETNVLGSWDKSARQYKIKV